MRSLGYWYPFNAMNRCTAVGESDLQLLKNYLLVLDALDTC